VAARWEGLPGGPGWGAAGGFYPPTRASARAPASPPASGRPRAANGWPRADRLPRLLDWLGRALPVNRDTRLRRALAGVFRWIDRRRPAPVLLERAELASKKPLFGCQAGGHSVLGQLACVFPQR